MRIPKFVMFRLALLMLVLLAPACQAHVPLTPAGNDNISSAEHISDPAKSWAIYSSIGPGRAEYYSFDMQKGDRIYLSLLSSADPQEKSFEPSMALIGPGLKLKNEPKNESKNESKNGLKDNLPGFVFIPKGYDFVAVQGMRAKNATYEPFGPSSYYQQAELNLSAPEAGRYYVAVYENQNNNQSNNRINNQSDNRSGGHYSLVLGYKEEFSFMDRITTPFKLISVYLWEGQRLTTIIIPWLVALLLGLFAVFRNPRRTPFYSAGTVAGFLFLGTSASILSQIVFNLTRAPFGPEVYISVALAAIPAILGVVLLRLARGEAGILQRSIMAVIGTVGLLAGSGLIIGSLIAISASVLPSRRRRPETADPVATGNSRNAD